jgi:3-isopropylmalate dehydrogenase
MARIALIPGDGIGREVLAESQRVLEAAATRFDIDIQTVEQDLGADRYLRDGVTITDDEFRDLADNYDGILLGALGDPRVPSNVHAKDILLGLRFKLDLYVNYRPAVLLDPALSPLRDASVIDLHVFRENTEGLYVGLGGTFKEGTADEVAIQESMNTHKGVERIIRAAFEFATARERRLVTLVDKANAMPFAGGLWRRVFAEVSGAYSGIETNLMYVDAMAMDLVRRPESYDVVVTSNLFGDILSDLAAELTGGLGLAPSANVHPGRHALFEPVHGSAPDIAGQGIANPVGAIRCAGLLLEHLGEQEAADVVEASVLAAFGRGVRTPDLGGTMKTDDVGRWIAEHVTST